MNAQEPHQNMPEETEQPPRIRKQLILSAIVLFFLILGSVILIFYGTGYRFGYQQGKATVSKTGILVANSQPGGAQVLIDGSLVTATDATLNLTPGEYTVKIAKEGYYPWEKKVRIEEKVVTELDALLFPMTLKLEGVSNVGVEKPVLDPLRTRIAFVVSTQDSFRRNGVYVYEMMTNPVLTLQGTVKQLVDDTFDSFSKSVLSWSPDSQDLVASISATPSRNQSLYVLDASSFTNAPEDVTSMLPTTEEVWNELRNEKEQARLQSLKRPVRDLITASFEVISWSPDDTKILYTAKRSGDIPFMIKPRLLGAINALSEDRAIKKGGVYVYSIKEDVNVKLFDALPDDCAEEEIPCSFPLTWFPDSEHLIFVHEKKIEIMGFDGSNKTTVYAGPFVDHYVFPWPDGSKLVILTNLNNPSTSSNLYTISLK